MSKVNLLISIPLILVLLSGCFKLGYQIELGHKEPIKQQELGSGYYYKSPAYYIK